MPRKIEVIHADCRDAIKKMADNSIDAVVTDPPYSLVSIQKRFGKPGSAAIKIKAHHGQSGSPHARAARGFMGQQWDTGETAFDPAFWAEVLRVLKPGAHLVAFGGSRTYHRLACAIEDAGFEIRDMVQWLYGSGFPKSHDVSKGIDKAAGAKRKVEGGGKWAGREAKPSDTESWRLRHEKPRMKTRSSTDDARQWEGWGTALKPAQEPIVLARKPLSEKTVVANVLKWGTGALNIDACRIEAPDGKSARVGHSNKKSAVHIFGPTHMHAEPDGRGRWPANVIHDGSEEVSAAFPKTGKGFFPAAGGRGGIGTSGHKGRVNLASGATDAGSAARYFHAAKPDPDEPVAKKSKGRWPANVIHDGSEEVSAAFPQSDSTRASGNKNMPTMRGGGKGSFGLGGAIGKQFADYGDKGAAGRFFYTAKADTDERVGSDHPTVKPVSLMIYLCKLIVPPGGVVLDPFAGTGTVGRACKGLGLDAILIEREAKYVADIKRKLDRPVIVPKRGPAPKYTGLLRHVDRKAK